MARIGRSCMTPFDSEVDMRNLEWHPIVGHPAPSGFPVEGMPQFMKCGVFPVLGRRLRRNVPRRPSSTQLLSGIL